jgi:hypothetical protein
MTRADPLLLASAWLVAVMVTGLGDGTPAGARYSTLAPLLAVTGWQGTDPAAQISPVDELPPGIPLTCHVKA